MCNIKDSTQHSSMERLHEAPPLSELSEPAATRQRLLTGRP